jgi:hypothetical protein
MKRERTLMALLTHRPCLTSLGAAHSHLVLSCEGVKPFWHLII